MATLKEQPFLSWLLASSGSVASELLCTWLNTDTQTIYIPDRITIFTQSSCGKHRTEFELFLETLGLGSECPAK